MRHRDRGIVGEATVDFIRQFKVDFGVIGISGIDLDGTLLDLDYREVRVSQAIIANSRKVLLVADHSKFSRSAMVRLGHISKVNMLFTDDPLFQRAWTPYSQRLRFRYSSPTPGTLPRRLTTADFPPSSSVIFFLVRFAQKFFLNVHLNILMGSI